MNATRTKPPAYLAMFGYLLVFVATANALAPPVPYGESNAFVLNTNCIGFGDSGVVIVVSVPQDDLPPVTALEDAVPNPFNPRTTISFSVELEGQVEVGIYDLRGRCLRHLVSQYLAPGRQARPWDGRTDDGSVLPSGIYLVRLESGDVVQTQKITLVR